MKPNVPAVCDGTPTPLPPLLILNLRPAGPTLCSHSRPRPAAVRTGRI